MMKLYLLLRSINWYSPTLFIYLLLTCGCTVRGQAPSDLPGTSPFKDFAGQTQAGGRDIPALHEYGLVPIPVNLESREGEFILDSLTTLQISPKNAELKDLAHFFAEMLAQPTGFALPVQAKKTGGKVIFLQLNDVGDPLIGKEGYRLEISPQKVKLSANEAPGLFYGMQTLLQLLPPEVEGNQVVRKASWNIPCMSISDFPRFQWRGLMLDVSRHFFPLSFVKEYIDRLAKYKMNVFHWHLSDDQGWRIEIKGLPRLTSVGAWRVPRSGVWWDRKGPQPGEKATYGGFYTQEEIREVIRYAEERFVTILPEIDVPGHSLAAIAAYPDLACVEDQYRVNPGSRYYGKIDNSLCIGNEETYRFLDKVFTEVAHLFPGEYIHVGGDEAYKGFWQKCPKCQRKIREEGLSGVHELQSYFIKRVAKILQAKGKKLIGWDEIMQGGLASGATVMSWRGMEGGIRAARMKHPVIMTPNTHCYLDLYQGDPAVEPPSYSKLLLSDSYRFNPVPEGVDPALILGGQGNLWTEYVPDSSHAEYMTWPRGLALAEVFWSPQERRQWPDFVRRMEKQFDRLDAAGVNYAQSAYDPVVTPRWAPGKKAVDIRIHTEIPGVKIYYSFEDQLSETSRREYEGKTLRLPADAKSVLVSSYRNGEKIGRTVRYSIPEIYGKLPAPM